MHVYVLARPRGDHSCIPLTGLRALSEALTGSALTVTPDLRPCTAANFAMAVQETVAQLSRVRIGSGPNLIHAFGTVASAAAVRWRPAGSRIVVTFDEFPSDDALEQRLASAADAVIPVSEAEQQRWVGLGARTLGYGGVPALPILPPISGTGAERVARNLVATTSTGPTLDALVGAMGSPLEHRVVVLRPPSARRWQQLQQRAARLGAEGRLVQAPEPHDAHFWSRVSAFVAGPEVARSGADCLLACAHGVPCLAACVQGHRDVVLHGITGVLLEPTTWTTSVVQALDGLLADPVGARGMGEAARVRAMTLHHPEHGGSRLAMLYTELLAKPLALPAEQDPNPDPRLTEDAGRSLPPDHNRLVIEHLPYARQLAQRYAGRGQSLDDLVQVAFLGLVHAAVRFDPDQGTEFYAFATPTILGELRRHFRDHAWAMHVPRTLQETTIRVRRVAEDLAAAGLRATATEIAAELGIVREEVIAAQRAQLEARATHSLDLPIGERGDESVADLIGHLDPGIAFVEAAGAVRGALRALPSRERDMLVLRYYGERSQAEIGAILGISQVQVSRLLSRTLAALRQNVLYDEPIPVPTA